MFISLPFFVLRAVPNLNSIEISFEPTREECLNLLLSIPRKIIKTVEDIPRVEQLLIKSNYNVKNLLSLKIKIYNY